ncbi:hypothetical protein TRFO_14545 [Tritrichomonas foetus]|uniref:Uncharacterized protein n=1 Tax=Tritrichomonas foetus TaxID=1144522 RepID=A0A1J4KZL7_9EUKA|nr:hypothetical protein TRFO_14545 [Tritrichomonas foetus]|eukprot:OHT15037.1 hypothetical protein TRFO_14545 [Tritrichomonas foetus]
MESIMTMTSFEKESSDWLKSLESNELSQSNEISNNQLNDISSNSYINSFSLLLNESENEKNSVPVISIISGNDQDDSTFTFTQTSEISGNDANIVISTKKSNNTIWIGIGIGSAIALAIIIVGMIVILKKLKRINLEEKNESISDPIVDVVVITSDPVVSIENPLASMEDNTDPFAEDFYEMPDTIIGF